MSRSDLEPGPELDALVAEKVLGWSYQTFPGPMEHVRHWYSTSPCPNDPAHESFMGRCPPYSTSIAHAWEVVPRILGNHPDWLLGRDDRDGKEFWCFYEELGDVYDTYVGAVSPEGQDAPHAICLAALKAVEAASEASS